MTEISEDRPRTLLDDIISEPVVVTVIVINAAVAVYLYAYPDQQSLLGGWTGWVDNACISFFVVEAGLKIYRLGWRGYFGVHWNKFDFAVTAASAPLLVAPLLGLPADLFGKIAIIRILRLLRLLRALRVAAATSLMNFLKQPVFTLLVLILLYEFVGIVEVEHEAKAWVLDGAIFAMIMAAAWLVERVYAAAHDNVLVPRSSARDWRVDATILTFLKIVAQLAIFFGGLVIAVDAIGHDPFHLMAGLGIGGMALAFAARDLVANVIGGLLVFIYRPFRVGERILVSGTDGWVNRIGLRETLIKDFYGESHFIPNKTFTETIVKNIDARSSYLMHVALKLHHDMTWQQVERALEILAEITVDDDLVLETHWTCFDSIEQDGFAVSLWYYIERWTPDDQATLGGEFHKIYLVQSRVNLAIMRRFQEAGIRLALPIEVHQRADAPAKGLYGG